MRIVKFSAVGAIGIVVQVAVLAVLTHLDVHYVIATICAVEAAVLHNFCWHQRFTWRDRIAQSVWSRLGRFHLSNAAISLVGNVAVMRLLVGALRMRAINANLVAIAICALINYLASDYWVCGEQGLRVSSHAALLSASAAAGPASARACAAQREHRSGQR